MMLHRQSCNSSHWCRSDPPTDSGDRRESHPTGQVCVERETHTSNFCTPKEAHQFLRRRTCDVALVGRSRAELPSRSLIIERKGHVDPSGPFGKRRWMPFVVRSDGGFYLKSKSTTATCDLTTTDKSEYHRKKRLFTNDRFCMSSSDEISKAMLGEQYARRNSMHRHILPKDSNHSVQVGDELCTRLVTANEMKQTGATGNEESRSNEESERYQKQLPSNESYGKEECKNTVQPRDQVGRQINSTSTGPRSMQPATVDQKRISTRHLQRAHTFSDSFKRIHISLQNVAIDTQLTQRINLWGAALLPSMNPRISDRLVPRAPPSEREPTWLNFSQVGDEPEAVDPQQLEVPWNCVPIAARTNAVDKLPNCCVQSFVVLYHELLTQYNICFRVSAAVCGHVASTATLFFRVQLVGAVLGTCNNFQKMDLPIRFAQECYCTPAKQFIGWCSNEAFSASASSLSAISLATSLLPRQVAQEMVGPSVPQVMRVVKPGEVQLLFGQEVCKSGRCEPNEAEEEFSQAALDVYFESMTTSKEVEGSVCSHDTTSVSIPLSKESDQYAEAADVSDASSSFCANSTDDNYEPIDSQPHEEEFEWTGNDCHGAYLQQYGTFDMEPISGIRSAPTRMETLWDTFGQLLVPYFIS